MKPLNVLIPELEAYLAEQLDITVEELKALVNTSGYVTTFADAKQTLNNLLKANRSLGIIYASAKSKLTRTESEEKRQIKIITDRFEIYIKKMSEAADNPLTTTDLPNITDLTSENITKLTISSRAKLAKSIASNIVREETCQWESIHLAVSKLMESIGREIATMRQLVDLLVSERYGMSAHNRAEKVRGEQDEQS